MLDDCSIITSMAIRRRTMCEGRLSSKKVKDTANSSLVTWACGLLRPLRLDALFFAFFVSVAFVFFCLCSRVELRRALMVVLVVVVVVVAALVEVPVAVGSGS